MNLLDMEAENKRLLLEGAKAFGIHLDEKICRYFNIYLKELIKWNQKINLTAIRKEREIILKHFLDSLSVIPHLPKISSLLDIGSGAGFPGIPIKIVRPDLKITLIDSVRKKVDFQRQIIYSLKLKGIDAIHGRVQEQRILQCLGGRFDGVVARAFSDLPTLLTLSSPLLKEKGTIIAMKGKMSGQEIQCLTEEDAIQYCLKKTVSFYLPFSSFKRTLLLFEKQVTPHTSGESGRDVGENLI